MSFFRKLGKGIGNTFKVGGRILGKAIKVATPIVGMVPGIGPLAGAATGVLGNVLDPQKSDSMISKVVEDGVVKVDKVESTISNQNPQMTALEVQKATSVAVKELTTIVPSAKVDDGKAVTKISMFEKLSQWVKSNLLLVGIGLVSVWFFFFKSGKNKPRKRW